MINLLKNKKRLVLILLVGLSIISILFIFTSTNKKEPVLPAATPSTSGIASWGKLTPGTSSQQDVIDVLGKPKNTEGDTLSFKSASSTRDTVVVIKNGTAELLKEVVSYSEKRNTEEITSKYGVAPNILYGQYSVNGDYLFVYPTNGIAYLGNPVTGSLMEIWYFVPVDINTFLSKWGQGYSTKPPKGTF
jgi:hypothetical protein